MELCLNYSIYLILFVLLFSCSTSSKLSENKKEPALKEEPLDVEQHLFQKKKAVEFFTKGSLLLNEGKAEEALQLLYEAVLYDSESLTIYIAISDALIQLKRFEEAELNLKKALKLDEQNLEVLEALGTVYLSMGKLEDALSTAKLILKQDPTNKNAFNVGLAIYEKDGRREELLQFVETYVEGIGYDAKMCNTIGVYYLSLENKERARQWFERCLKIDPDHLNAQINLSRLDISEGKKQEGLENLKEILKKNPEKLNALIELIETYRREDKYSEIIALAGTLESKDQVVKLYLAEAYFKEDQFKHAQKLFAEVPLNKFNVYFEFLAGDCELRLENYESALAHFNSIIRREPAAAQGYYGAGYILIQQKEFEEAEEVLRTGLVKSNADDLLKPMLAKTLLNLNKHTEANRYLERMLKEKPNDVGTLLEVAQAYQSAEIYEKSDPLFEKAISLDGENATILNNYSYSLSKREIKLEYALELIKKALQKEPENGFFLDTMGWVYFKLKNYELAKKFILKSLEVRGDESSSEVLDHMGDVYKALNKPKLAKKYYRKALDKDTGNIKLKEKLKELSHIDDK